MAEPEGSGLSREWEVRKQRHSVDDSSNKYDHEGEGRGSRVVGEGVGLRGFCMW